MKYLERAELANFTFQNDILKPFVVLMRNSQSESIRSLIVDCIVQVRQTTNFYSELVKITLLCFILLDISSPFIRFFFIADDKIKSW